MPVMRGEYAEGLAPALVPMTLRGYNTKFERYSRFMKILNSSNAWEDDRPMDASFGPMPPKPELETTVLDEPFKLPGQRIFMNTYALAYLISWEFMADEKIGLAGALAAALGDSSRLTAELYGHDVINNGFNAAKYAGRDLKALFATDHPMFGPAGGTIANRPAVDVDLSEAALEAAILSFRRQKNERGLPIESTPRILLISPEQEFTARRILETVGRPGTNEWGSINVLRDQGLQIMIDEWLTDTDAWYLLGTDHDIRFYWRQRMNTYTWDDLNAGGVFHKVDQRHGQGFGDWRNTYGSPGA